MNDRRVARCLEQLAGLDLPLRGRVLLIGSDDPSFFSDRGCSATCQSVTAPGDRLELPPGDDSYDVVVWFDALPGVGDPAQAIRTLAPHCRDLLILEAAVRGGGLNQLPTRRQVFDWLRGLFECVYLPTTQPAHEEFPLDWRALNPSHAVVRAMFIASRLPLANAQLVEGLPDLQDRAAVGRSAGSA